MVCFGWIVIGWVIIFVLKIFIWWIWVVCCLIDIFLWIKLMLFFWVRVIVRCVFVIVFIDVEIIGMFSVIFLVNWVWRLVVFGRMVEWVGMSKILLKVRVFFVICSMCNIL